MNRYIQWIFFSLAAVCLSACQTGPGVLEAEVQPEASAAPDAEVVAEIQPVVNAIMSGNLNQRKVLIEFLNTPCTTRNGLGGPPPCAENETEGTLVEVLPVLESEGYYLRPHEIERGLQFMVKRLYAVYREIPNPEGQPYWPSGGYVLIFDREQNDFPVPVSVLVQDGKIVRITHHTDIAPEDLLQIVAAVDQVVLAPSEAQALNPTPSPGDPTADPGRIDFSVIPAPLEWPTYKNEELGYQIQYMPEWMIEEHGLSQRTKEVIFNPLNPEDFKLALSVALDERPLDVIRQLNAESQPEALASEVQFAGEEAILYRYPWGRVEVYVPHNGRVYVISTDYGDQTRYLQPLASFRFIR